MNNNNNNKKKNKKKTCFNWIKKIVYFFQAAKLPRLSTNNDGKPGTIQDTLTVLLRMSTIPLRLHCGLGHAHKPLRFIPEILNSLKLP